jgi:hypothetical protein
VYTRSRGVWSQQAKLVATDAIGFEVLQGSSVSLSADGKTALVGGPNDTKEAGAAWVYTRSRGVWSQQAKLVGTDAIGPVVERGASVSLSADGKTALVGGSADNNFVGAAWVYTRSRGVWSQQAKLVATDAIGPIGGVQGSSVSLSADGKTALVGGPYDNNYAGAAWVYTRRAACGASRRNWSPQTP